MKGGVRPAGGGEAHVAASGREHLDHVLGLQDLGLGVRERHQRPIAPGRGSHADAGVGQQRRDSGYHPAFRETTRNTLSMRRSSSFVPVLRGRCGVRGKNERRRPWGTGVGIVRRTSGTAGSSATPPLGSPGRGA